MQSAAAPNGITWLSSKKTVADWLAIEPTLVGADTPTWSTVMDDYYYDRLKTRYLDPIASIRQQGISRGEGFAIVAILCSLIEFLESCAQGINYHYGRRKGWLARAMSRLRSAQWKSTTVDYTYSDSAKLFVDFLTKRSPLNASFPTRALGKEFYVAVRCGILHEACTKGQWRVWDRNPAKPPLVVDGVNKILYRDDLEDAVTTFIQQYRTTVPTAPSLQQAFVRKFNHLCR